MNKKGSIVDVAIIPATLFLLALLFIFFYRIQTDVNTEIQASPHFNNFTKDFSNQTVSYYPNIFNNSFMLIALGLAIASFIFAALVRVHPIFIIFYIIGLIIVVVLSSVFSNAYETLANNPQLSTLATNMTHVNYIMRYLPLLVAIIGSILAIIMYKGYKDSQSYV